MSEQKQKPQVELLPKLFANFKDPRPIAFMPGMNKNKSKRDYLLGSKAFTKIIMFAAEVQLNNDDIDYWCQQKPQRSEGEPYELYKQRLKFTGLLDKYRPYLFNYQLKEIKYSGKRAKKAMQKLSIK